MRNFKNMFMVIKRDEVKKIELGWKFQFNKILYVKYSGKRWLVFFEKIVKYEA